jgi:hypothetical protein
MENNLTMQPISMSELMEIEGGVLPVILAALALSWGIAAVGAGIAYGMSRLLE